MNEVIYSALADDEADRVIDETIAGYRELGLKFRWNGGPGSTPADLGERLVRRGLTESWGRGMVRSTELASDPEPGCEVASVGADTIGEFSHVMAAGWNVDPAPLAELHRGSLGKPQHRHFLASCDGVAAGAASYTAFERSAFLIGAVVLPQFRGRGLYRALVAARLAHARSHGLELATTHARESTSAPILERLGFETACRLAMYFS
jgi:GNAT superfamily N-acetyltransferase